MPGLPKNQAITEALLEQNPKLIRIALDRVETGRSLFVVGNKLRDDLRPEIARMILLLAIGIFVETTGYRPKRFVLTKAEKRLLSAIMEFPLD
jgi:hypothetical protein